MKKLCVVLFIVSCLAGIVSAEDATETKGSLPPPEKKGMTLPELKASLAEMDGKVVKVSINNIYGFEQIEKGKYRTWCSSGSSRSSENILVLEEGRSFFTSLMERGDLDSSRSLYLKVRSGDPLTITKENSRWTYRFEAVGNSYNESENRYEWLSASQQKNGDRESENTSSFPPPEKKEIKLSELKAQMLEFDGKVVKVSINHVYDFEQIGNGKYRAYCGFWGSGAHASESMLIPESGKEFFQEIAKQDNYDSGGKPVYLLVRKSNPSRLGNSYPLYFEAVGTRYSKSDEAYKW